MILLPFFVVKQTGRSITHTAELAQATELLRAAYTGRGGVILPPFDQQSLPTVDESGLRVRGTRIYNFGIADVGFDTTSGKIVFFNSRPLAESPAWELDGKGGIRVVPRALTDKEATELATQDYDAAGWPGGITVLGITDLMGGNHTCVEVRYAPTWHNVPYFQDYTMDLDRQTGRLETFEASRWLPAPPDSPIPGGTSVQARFAALSVALPWFGAPLTEDPRKPFRLALWWNKPQAITNPHLFGRERFTASLPARHMADLRSGRAILAYMGTLTAGKDRKVEVSIDALTGQVLTLFVPDFSFGKGGFDPKPKLPTLAVPLAARPWRVATGRKGWDAWTAPANATLTPASGAAPKGARLTVTDGKAAFPAAYDPKTGLLAVSGKAYRPGPALAALLKRRTKG